MLSRCERVLFATAMTVGVAFVALLVAVPSTPGRAPAPLPRPAAVAREACEEDLPGHWWLLHGSAGNDGLWHVILTEDGRICTHNEGGAFYVGTWHLAGGRVEIAERLTDVTGPIGEEKESAWAFSRAQWSRGKVVHLEGTATGDYPGRVVLSRERPLGR